MRGTRPAVRLWRLPGLVFTVVLWPATITGQPPPGLLTSEPTFSGFSIYTDQDLLAQWIDNQDRNYTMGVGFSAAGGFVTRLPNAKAHYWLDDLLGLGPELEHLTFHSLTLAGSGFTPDSLLAEDPVIGDRPYGSLLVLSSRRLQVRGGDQNVAVTTELIVGGIGLGVSDWVQTTIHENNSSDVPMGWDHQISDGGEPTVAYRVAVEARLRDFPGMNAVKYFDMSAGGEVWAGYYTNVAAGYTVRLGRFYSEFWEFNSAPLQAVAQAVQLKQSAPRGEIFVFGSLRGRGVIYNALLQGQFRDSDYTLSSDEMQHFLAETQFGVAGTLGMGGWAANASYIVSARTSEIVGPFARTHFYGSLNLAFSRPLGGPPGP